ncbi:MAG: UvrD-helicase domain-containing protein [Candidatus Delongbacteria bacterium]|nr:UvrD-helicase domain-containing protein [Candidatus Delongbacteria bacterium]
MDFNNSQIQAIEHLNGPCLVLAGAGSGKTRVIIGRIKNLVFKHKISPRNILAVTFTNKAAEEMTDRLKGSVKDFNEITCSTFHALGVRIIRENVKTIGYRKNFTIYDSAAQHAVIKKAMHNLNISTDMFDPKLIHYKLSAIKNTYQNLDNIPALDPISTLAKRILPEYKRILKFNNAFDFDDLLLVMLELLSEHPEVLHKYQRKFKYIMVDEFQDTNPIQNAIINHLAGDHNNLFVVGDDDQSIYAFRGADFRNILDFEKKWKGCKTIVLDVNYRSTSTILSAADSIIGNNKERKAKNVKAHHKINVPLEYFQGIDAIHEAKLIAERIKDDKNKNFADYAVLMRTNYLSRNIEEVFRESNIPYKIVGDYKFYDRKEIKDILAYLAVLSNPSDEVSTLRIINTPKRGIGEDTVFKISNYAEQENINFYAALRSFKKISTISTPKHFNLTQFLDIIIKNIEYSNSHSVSDTLLNIIDDIDYFGYLNKENTKASVSRVANVEELINSVKRYEKEVRNPTINGFMEKVSLLQESDDTNHGNQVLVLTLHSSKGLEFENVFICGFEEGILPHKRSLEENNLEEERRLCYVGVTRAKRKLYLSSASMRMQYGKEIKSEPSRFLKEIPEDLFLYPPSQASEKNVENAKSKLNELMEKIKAKYANS